MEILACNVSVNHLTTLGTNVLFSQFKNWGLNYINCTVIKVIKTQTSFQI